MPPSTNRANLIDTAARIVADRRGKHAEADGKANPDAWLSATRAGIRGELLEAGAHAAAHSGMNADQIADLVEPRVSVPAAESRVLSLVDRLSTLADCNECRGTGWIVDDDIDDDVISRRCTHCNKDPLDQTGTT